MEGARFEVPAISGWAGATATRFNDENSEIYRPQNIEIIPPNLNCSSAEFLGFEKNFLRFAQRFDFTKALLE